ncbi:MAG: cytochrome P450 [Verrucomicrobiota bacterium]
MISLNSSTAFFFTTDFQQNPYPYYYYLRKHSPVMFSEEKQAWIISRYDDCLAVLNSPNIYSNTHCSFESTLVGANGEPHDRVRSIVRKLFNQQTIKLLEDYLPIWVQELTQDIDKEGSCEFMQEVAELLPTKIVAFLLRLKPENCSDLKRWSDALINPESFNPKNGQEDPVGECRNFFKKHINQTRRQNTQDGFSELFVLNDNEINDICMIMTAAGLVTTNDLLGTIVKILAESSSLADLLRKSPSNIPLFIEEVVRFESPTQSIRRTTLSPSQINGILIPEGHKIELLLASANRDEKQFPDADKFQYNRRRNKHLGFGFGNHQCLGMNLARLEAKIVIKTLLNQFSNISPNWPLDEPPLVNYSVFRGPKKLPLTLERFK